MEHKAGEIRRADQGRNQRRDHICGERRCDGSKRCADDDRNGKIDHVPPQDEIAKSFEHNDGLPLSVARLTERVMRD